MAYDSFKKTVSGRLAEIRAAGLYKSERQILGPQGAEIRVAQGEVLNLCPLERVGCVQVKFLTAEKPWYGEGAAVVS